MDRDIEGEVGCLAVPGSTAHEDDLAAAVAGTALYLLVSGLLVGFCFWWVRLVS